MRSTSHESHHDHAAGFHLHRDDAGGYARLSTRPLTILLFLLPLILLYQLGSALYLAPESAGGSGETIRALRLLGQFFQAFGVSGLYLPGVLLVVILLVWHVLARDPWRARGRGRTLVAMLFESVAWAFPLLVFAQMYWRLARRPAGVLAAADGLPALGPPSWQHQATIALGAGLWEEMLFRLLAIALLHILAADLFRMKDVPARIAAIAGAAVLFAVYHDVYRAEGGILWVDLLFYFLSGCYLGGLYLWRGFGIAVAVHALYNLTVLVVLRG
ncbi:MAG: CPBP family intramembrane metalloprotease [Phycisphaerales bacterium]|nr:CPBP family intramembrane metalloprotease [Phycisphaerales bacterium]